MVLFIKTINAKTLIDESNIFFREWLPRSEAFNTFSEELKKFETSSTFSKSGRNVIQKVVTRYFKCLTFSKVSAKFVAKKFPIEGLDMNHMANSIGSQMKELLDTFEHEIENHPKQQKLLDIYDEIWDQANTQLEAWNKRVSRLSGERI
jgi:hypothetical protein